MSKENKIRLAYINLPEELQLAVDEHKKLVEYLNFAIQAYDCNRARELLESLRVTHAKAK